MDENRGNQRNQEEIDDINRFTMDENGKIRHGTGSAAIAGTSRTYIILGWICAGLTLLVSVYFAIGGVVFGVLANRQAKGSGNTVIISNVVLGAIHLFFGFFIAAMLRMMVGY